MSDAPDLTELVQDLRARLDVVRRGGSPKAHERHSALAADGMYDDSVPSAGIVTGIGRISGRECVVVAQGDQVALGAVLFVVEEAGGG